MQQGHRTVKYFLYAVQVTLKNLRLTLKPELL